jgi:OmpA-OmpF porin, OOP family
LFSLFLMESSGQNLVRNSGFELTKRELFCGVIGARLEFENRMLFWTCPTTHAPFVYSTNVYPHCWNFISPVDKVQPHGGKNFAQLYLYGGADLRSYLQIELSEPLLPNKTYHTQMWVRWKSGVDYICNNIGIFFSDSPVEKFRIDRGGLLGLPFQENLNVKPHLAYTELLNDTSSWICLKQTFKPKTKVRYMIVGNFSSDAETEIVKLSGQDIEHPVVRIFIDDVYVGRKPPESEN